MKTTTRKQTANTQAQAPEAQAPEAQAPEAQAPEAQAPEAQALVDANVFAPEAQAPEAQAPEAQAPEAQAPEAQAPEAQAPEAQAPEAQAPAPTMTLMYSTDDVVVHKTAKGKSVRTVGAINRAFLPQKIRVAIALEDSYALATHGRYNPLIEGASAVISKKEIGQLSLSLTGLDVLKSLIAGSQAEANKDNMRHLMQWLANQPDVKSAKRQAYKSLAVQLIDYWQE